MSDSSEVSRVVSGEKNVTISLVWFGLLTTLLPLTTIHVTYLVSATQGYVDWCVPYWHSCTSISATGRNGLSYFLFKGAMIPALVLTALFWLINHSWLQSLGHRDGKHMAWLGLVAAFFMLIYTLALGHVGDGFYLLRRIGVIGYIGMTAIAQILLGAVLYRSAHGLLSRSGRRLLTLSGVTLGIAIFSLILDALPAVDYSELDDAFEWVLIVLMNLHGIGVVLVWRKAGLAITLPRARRLG